MTHNKVIQKKYMLGRFGTIKTYILLSLYRHYFTKTIRNYIKYNVGNNVEKDKIESMKKMYKYIYYNQDIYSSSNFIQISKEKLFEFSITYPEDFFPILERFGYICNHTTRAGNKCHKKCDNFECKTHKNCTLRLTDRIKTHLELPKVLVNIVLSYVLPVY